MSDKKKNTPNDTCEIKVTIPKEYKKHLHILAIEGEMSLTELVVKGLFTAYPFKTKKGKSHNVPNSENEPNTEKGEKVENDTETPNTPEVPNVPKTPETPDTPESQNNPESPNTEKMEKRLLELKKLLSDARNGTGRLLPQEEYKAVCTEINTLSNKLGHK